MVENADDKVSTSDFSLDVDKGPVAEKYYDLRHFFV